MASSAGNSVSEYLAGVYAMLDRHPQLTEKALIELAGGTDGPSAQHGAVLLAARRYRSGNSSGAVDALAVHLRERGPLPVQALLLLMILREAVGQAEEIPGDLLAYGCTAIQSGEEPAVGAEAVSLALVEDAKGAMRLIQDTRAVQRSAAAYERIATGLPRPVGISHPDDSRLRVGIIVANLVDHLVAYSNRALFFARYLDASRYRLFVYSSENMCHRQRVLPFPHGAPPSAATSPAYQAELRARGIPLFLTPHEGTLIDAAQRLAEQLARDGIDILLLQSGVTMPVDWLACRLAPAPVKMQIHIGLSALVPGLDLTLFDNAVNLERERFAWPAGAGEPRLMRRGTDLDALDVQAPLNRSMHGIPADAVVIGVLSNDLAKRLSGDYLMTLIRVLKLRPQAWFMPVGGSHLPETAQRLLAENGVISRVVHLPAQRQVGSALKVMDVYAAEFPVSGSQSVVEAMGCGLPVAAMCVGASHYASIGADLIGRDAAITEATPEAYTARLLDWVDHPDTRRQAGASMRRRAEAEFHVKDFVRQVCETGEVLFRRKNGTCLNA